MIKLVKYIFTISSIVLLTSIHCHAQYHDNVWTFGYSFAPCDSTVNFGGSNLFFDEEIVTSEYHCRNIQFAGNLTASISDAEGNLKLMFNGCTMNDADHNIISGCDDLLDIDTNIEQEWCDLGFNTPGGAFFLPDPYEEDRYYLFYRDLIQIDPMPYVVSDSFYVSTILFDDEVATIESKGVVVPDTVSRSGTAMVKHSNGIDWWIFVKHQFKNKYFSILVDSNGPQLNGSQLIDNSENTLNGGSTKSVSPDGQYLATYDPFQNFEVFKIDRVLGSLSPYINIESWVDDIKNKVLDIEFSPSGQYLYVAETDTLWQFDMTADVDDFFSTKTTVGIYDGFTDPFPTNFWLMQTARDGKIYMSARNSSKFLHVIHAPDERGLDCDFRQHDYELPTVNAFAMPYFPNFRLGADSSYVSTNEIVEPPAYKIYPNPATDRITVKGDRYDTAVIYDIYGIRVITSTERDIDVSNLQGGIYIIQFYKENDLLSTHKFIKI